MRAFDSLAACRERLAGPPSRRAAYYILAHVSYNCLAGSFEMPMALRLAGRVDYVALVYAFYYCTLLLGFATGLVLVREGRASLVFRLDLGLLTLLSFGAAVFFPFMRGIGALVPYFLVRGMAEGFFWAARHRAMLWSVKDAARDRFALRLQSISIAVTVVLPLVGGLAITGLDFLDSAARRAGPASAGALPPGYVAVFSITGTAVLTALLLSPRFAIGRSPLSFAKVRAVNRLPEAAGWRAYIGMTAFAGVFVGVGAGVLNFGILRTEFRIGAFNASIAFLSGLSFYLLSRFAAGRPGLRPKAVVIGAMAEFTSRASYALVPLPGVLVAKGVLDSAAVPLKNLLGDNVIFSLAERVSVRSEASIAEVYLFREVRIWAFRMLACGAAGLVVALAAAGGAAAAAAAVPAAAEIVRNGREIGRILLAIAIPVPLAEALFIRSFARANARAAAQAPAPAGAPARAPAGAGRGSD